MQIIRLDALAFHQITQFDSAKLSAAPLVKSSDPAQIIVMTLDRDGQIGFHQATVPQLFVVVRGAGWVCGESRERSAIAAGEAALWNAGEWHAAGTPESLLALVIESPSLERFNRA
jgi:quercetin dioxygenase-like cupin family protein